MIAFSEIVSVARHTCQQGDAQCRKREICQRGEGNIMLPPSSENNLPKQCVVPEPWPRESSTEEKSLRAMSKTLVLVNRALRLCSLLNCSCNLADAVTR